MTDTSNRAVPRVGADPGLPMRSIAIPEPIPTSSSSSRPPSDVVTTDAQPKRGIHVRVNSLSAAAMFKSSSAASTSSSSSTAQQQTLSMSKTRPRSSTVTDSEMSVTAQSPSVLVQHDSASSSSSSAGISRQLLRPTTSSSASSNRIFSFQSQKASDLSTSAGSGDGVNRRKFFGRSNSIRMLLGGASGSSDSKGPGSSSERKASSASSVKGQHEIPQTPGLLRRMGSKSLLNVNQSNPGTINNSSTDDLSSVTSADSHASRRFSDSLKGFGRRREKSGSRETSYSRSSSEAYTARLAQADSATGRAGSKKSIESVRSSVSVTSPEPHPQSSGSDSSHHHHQPAADTQEQQSSTPRRFTGWLYNMVGSDNASISRDGGAPLSPVHEAGSLDFAHSSSGPVRQDVGDSGSPSSAQNAHRQLDSDTFELPSAQPNAPLRSKAGAFIQSLTPAGLNKAVRTASGGQATSGASSSGTGNAGMGSNSGTSSSNPAGAGGSGGGNNGSWVPAGVGFDRAFKFFMDSDPATKDDEGIWLLGVYHGPRQADPSEASTLPPALPVAAPTATGTALKKQETGDDTSVEHRASSPSSLASASSPRPSPVDLVHPSAASSSPAFDRASAPSTRVESRIGSSLSTAATGSTSDSIRSRSSATSSNVVPRASPSVASGSQSAFHRDFASRIWCTYRNHFAPIARDGTISDEAAAAAELSTTAQLAAMQERSVVSPSSGTASSEDAARSSSPAASAGRSWLGRKVTQSNAGQEAAAQNNTALGLGAALGAGYANASSTLGEKMGITNLWGRATAAAQAAGFSRAGLTTDSGWGCMLRTGQSLLANALLHIHLGRDWLREQPPMGQVAFLEDLAKSALEPAAEKQILLEWRQKRARHSTYIKILSWFLDDPSPACPFGIHRMAREGKRLGKEVGEWFGPSTAAGAIKQLVSEFPDAGIAVQLAHDGVFYLDEVRVAAGAKTSAKSSQHLGKARASPLEAHGGSTDGVAWKRPVLILIGIRLGLDSVNPVYYESVKATFTFPHSVGIAGGRPSSSYYFTGHQGNSLFYLDPHNVRPAVPLRYPPSSFPPAVSRQHDTAHRFVLEDQDDEDEWWSHAYTEALTSTFHCEKVRRMPIKSLDPSMLLGFLVKDEADLVDLCARIKAMPKTIFSFAESAPKWVDDDDFDPSMESFSESSVGGESDDDADESKDGHAGARAAKSEGEAASASVHPPTKDDAASSDNMLKETQQRTAAWLGQDRSSKPSAGATRANASAGAIAFPSLDMPSLQSESHAVPRPTRLDIRQASTSSAATTRPVRRGSPADRTKGRDLIASQAAAAKQNSPSPSPDAGADESFSTVHISDTEIGSAWEEVSDGGTIAPSISAGGALLRSASPLRAVPMTTVATEVLPQSGAEHPAEPVENPISPMSIVSDADLVSLSLDTPVNEDPTSERAELVEHRNVAFPTQPPAEEGSYFALNRAHKPSALPRRRSHSRPPPPEALAEDAAVIPDKKAQTGEDVRIDAGHDDDELR